MKYSNHSYLYSYIYKLILKDQSTYVGLRHCNCLPENDPYLDSGRAYQKSDVIKKEILISGNFDDKTLAILETVAIMDDKSVNPKNLNRNLGAYFFNQYCLSRFDEKGHELMQQRAKERWNNPEVRAKLEYARKHQMEGNDVKKRISQTVRKTCSDPKWKKEHSELIKNSPYYVVLGEYKNKIAYRELQKLLYRIENVEEGRKRVENYLKCKL